jgi:hypothetical protein
MAAPTTQADPTYPSEKLGVQETVSQDPHQHPSGLVTTDKAKLDVAAEFLLLHEQAYSDYTPAEASRVRWKIDLRLVPMLFVTQTLCAVDVRGIPGTCAAMC